MKNRTEKKTKKGRRKNKRKEGSQRERKVWC